MKANKKVNLEQTNLLANLIVKILNLYIFFYILTCITLLSSTYPLPAMHSLLVTLDIRKNFNRYETEVNLVATRSHLEVAKSYGW